MLTQRSKSFVGAFVVIGAATASSALSPLAAAPSALKFDLTARVASVDAAGKPSGPSQTLDANVALAGDKARLETKMAGRRSVLIYAAPYLYRLLPASKAGVRWNAPTPKNGNFDPRDVLRRPDELRGLLTRYGARRIGTAKLGGVPVDGYELRNGVQTPGGKLVYARAWLRRADALPLKFEARTSGFKIDVSWRNYARTNVSSSLFTPPAGYAIRNAQTPPPMLF